MAFWELFSSFSISKNLSFFFDKYLRSLDHGSFEDLSGSSGVWGFEIKFIG